MRERKNEMNSPETSKIRGAGPLRTPVNRLQEAWVRFISNTPKGNAIGKWVSKMISLPQLGRLADGGIPWAPLRKPISESTVVLITTGGVHLRTDRPFNMNSDSSFRVIPKNAEPSDLAISHQAYDRTDALRDINLVFPIERLRELEEERVIGRLTDDHYGFGLMAVAKRLVPSMREVARRIRDAGADLALLAPA
jgi:D-proline reductase (dithiol) PrdB